MSTPIKTLLLNDIRSTVESISDIKKVYLDPSRMPHENEPDIYTAIFTMPESTKKEDLYSLREFEFSIETWVKADDDDLMREKSIDLNSQIAQKLLDLNSTAREYCQYLEETEGAAADVLFYGDFCIAVNIYKCKYRTSYANPYQINPL